MVRTQSILVYRNCKCTEPTAPRTCPCSLGAMPMRSPRGSHLSSPPQLVLWMLRPILSALSASSFLLLPPLLLLLRQPACPELGGRGWRGLANSGGPPGCSGYVIDADQPAYMSSMMSSSDDLSWLLCNSDPLAQDILARSGLDRLVVPPLPSSALPHRICLTCQ